MQNDYNALAAEVSSLTRKFEGCVSREDRSRLSAESTVSQAEKLAEAIRDFEAKAELKDKAGEAVKAVEDGIKNINTELAKKFLPYDYAKTADAARDFLKRAKSDGDSYTVKNFPAVLGMITEFSCDLDKAYNEYLARKNGIIAAIDELSGRLGRELFSRPEDDFDGSSAHKLLSLTKFLEEFGEGRYVPELESGLEKARKLLEKEDFNGADKQIEAVSGIAAEASAYAVKTHENRKKIIVTALAIQSAMLKNGYDVETSYNEDINDGFRIKCIAGDEEILFDKGTVKDGKPVIDIDHKEATAGTCAGPWENIRKDLAGKCNLRRLKLWNPMRR